MTSTTAARAGVPLLLLAALACGGGGSTSASDAAPVEAGGETAGTVPTSCDLAAQTGCAADQQCSVFCDPQKLVVACRAEPADGPGLGQPCMNVPCARGGACIAAAGMDATCRKLCTVAEECPTGQVCRDVNVTYGCAITGPTSVHIKACI